MSDLIDRQAAIKLISQHTFYDDYDGIDKCSLLDGLRELPSAEPEIVYCKDCKHRIAESGFCEGRGWPMQLVPDDGFCDKGER